MARPAAGPDRFDVIVVGAGPAGAAAAIAARYADPAARVLLLDRAPFPRDKACGDGIAPHAVDVLATLGALRVLEGFRPVARLRVRSPSGVTAAGTLRRYDWVVPRKVFDARLVTVAEAAGATLWRHRVRTVRQDVCGVVLDDVVSAPAVVATDGAHSVVRRRLGLDANPPRHRAVAIRGYAPTSDAEQSIVMRAEDWPSYAWRFPVGDGTANVGYGALHSRFDGTREALLGRMERALGPTAVDPATVRGHTLPLSSHRPPPAVGRVLLAGDAASFVNPLSGEGIYYALLTGALAGAAATRPATAADRYRADLRVLLRRHFRHTTLLARALRYPWLAEAGVAAARRSPAVFDDLCELTLGRGTVTRRLAAGTVRSVRYVSGVGDQPDRTERREAQYR
jgi:menaquinone-9 beta-reductase